MTGCKRALGHGFSSERLLIANFNETAATLMKAVKELPKPGLFPSPPAFILMHPLAIISGGLSQVEDRVLRDLAATCARAATCGWATNSPMRRFWSGPAGPEQHPARRQTPGAPQR